MGFAEQVQPTKKIILHASADELAIRSARVQLNVALVNRDLKTTVKYWLPELNTIGGDGSLWADLDQNIEGFTKIFNDLGFVAGLRTPNNIGVATGSQRELLNLESERGGRLKISKLLLTVGNTLLCGSL